MSSSTDQPLSFQALILKLEAFWAARGCVIWQPYHAELGAGTMNPATFLRVLGPEPWRVAYVEPSIRPDDGRYGENPNRLQQHYQYQVILKPDPGNPQELYLESLEALGIRAREHDIRFVEDNWESPALGAWGLGWEVWLNGQEITQFTYFQQAGGQVLDPVSVEITYGLERIAMALQGISGFRDIRWTGPITYGDLHLQAEQEHSRYFFEVADVERLRQLFALYEAEAAAALAAGLVLPAHDYVLKCSHTFNVLDTRGAVGVTERAGLFGRMRDLSRRLAEAYLEQRQRLEFPLLGADESEPAGPAVAVASKPATPSTVRAARTGGTPVRDGKTAVPEAPTDRQTFVLEIGTEELPAADVDAALDQLRQLISARLAELRLTHGEMRVLGTPRRLVVRVDGLAPSQPDHQTWVKGPPAARAFDQAGRPTQAALGFARSRGIPVDTLERRSLDGGEYAVALVRESGRPAPQVLAEALPQAIAALRFDKSMRWNESGVGFARPIRWLIALLGDQVIPFDYAGVRADRWTHGLRLDGSPEIEVPDADAYEPLLRKHGVLLDPAERRQAIQRSVERAAAAVQGRAHHGPGLLAEVGNLIEQPTAVVGQFDRDFLELPAEVLETVMKKHQRYFPIVDAKDDARLLPYFVAIRNGDDQHLENVRRGNEHVLGARFADARYFVREDLKQPLSAYRPQLSRLTFQAKLGTMLDKSDRVEALTAKVASVLGLSADQMATAQRAAHLAKADLVTHMVTEMTSLQGVIGREYALRSGESTDVARAIKEQYRTDASVSPSGLALGLADRMDSLVGLFSVGLAPTGTKDPYALRRAALGIVQLLLATERRLDLRQVARAAAGLQPVAAGEQVVSKVLDFIAGRLRNVLIESGLRVDVVEAVLAAQGTDPAAARATAVQLSEWISRPEWPQVLAAYSRCVRITRELDERFTVQPKRFVEPAEHDLAEAVDRMERAVQADRTLNGLLDALAHEVPAISKFFEDVLVMHSDPALRANRLGLLQRVAALADGIADLSKLENF